MIRSIGLAALALAAILQGGCAGLLVPQQEPERAAMTFYVDFDGGADDNDGLTPATAFKHAPGDPAATDEPGALELIPGDRVVFKGSVRYRGELVIPWAGERGAPIVFDGNTAGTFGAGSAILDGGERITGWKRCASADECGGAACWAHVFRAPAPRAAEALTSNLHQDGRRLILAQHPNPSSTAFTDTISEYLVTAPATSPRTRLADPRLAGWGGEALVGATVYVWRRTNQIDTRLITGYDAEAGAIRFDELGGPVYPEIRYALANSLSSAVFDRPGEYVFQSCAAGGDPTIYLWPLDERDPNTLDVTVAVRPLAIALTGENHFVAIQGFRVQNYQRAIFRADKLGRARGVVIRDNEFTRLKSRGYANAVELYDTDELLLAGNHLHDCPRTRGLIAHGGYGAVLRDNRLVRMGRTPIVMYGMTRGKILGNTVLHCRGMHSNGISVYLNNRDILIEGNRVIDANIALTCSATTNLTIRNNIFDGVGRAQPISFWEGVKGEVTIENNILIGSGRRVAVGITGLGDKTGASFDMNLVLRRNIMDGPATHLMAGKPWLRRTARAGNLYVSTPEGFVLAVNEGLVDDLDAIMPGRGDRKYGLARGVVAGPVWLRNTGVDRTAVRAGRP